MPDRTNKQIVKQTNDLARAFYQALGYQVKEGYRFDRARHPQEIGMWRLACIAQEMLTDTDAENALAEVEEEER